MDRTGPIPGPAQLNAEDPIVNMQRQALSCLAAFLISVGVNGAEPKVEGTVRFDELVWEAIDAIAYQHDEDELRVVFSNTRFDREAMLADGRIDAFTLMKHSGSWLALAIGKDGPGNCLQFFHRSEAARSSGGACDNTFVDAMEIERQEDGRIAGRMRWNPPHGEYIRLAFDVPVL
jgi:hypothetical protein